MNCYNLSHHALDEYSCCTIFVCRILVGAPAGIFPGGISGIEIDSLACAEHLGTTDEVVLSATTQEERMNCLANLTTGLVYRCNLNEPDCGPLLGNGNARSPDGYLFDRIGNWFFMCEYNVFVIFSDKPYFVLHYEYS